MGWTQALDGVGLEVLALVVFLAAFLETVPPIGLVVPGQTTIVGCAFLAGRRGEGAWLLGGAVLLGAVAGDVAGYVLGRRTGMGFLQTIPRRFRPARARMAWLEHLFHTHGMKTVLVARFQPLTRCFAPLLAGAVQMPPPRFMLASVAGASLASGLLVAGGYLTGLGFARLGKVLGTGVAVLGVAAVAVIVLLSLHLRRKHLADRIEPHVRPAQLPQDAPAVAGLLRQYFQEFQTELGAQDFAGELGRLESYYAPPNVLLVAEAGGVVVGCVGLRDMGGEGELKRMVVHPDWRGAGVGRKLATAVVEEARRRGMRRLMLDTTPAMAPARRLYQSVGFRESPPYYASSPLREPVFMELPLTDG